MKRRGITAGVLEDADGPEHGFWAVVLGRTGNILWHSETAFPDTAAAFAAAADKKATLVATTPPPKPSKGKK